MNHLAKQEAKYMYVLQGRILWAVFGIFHSSNILLQTISQTKFIIMKIYFQLTQNKILFLNVYIFMLKCYHLAKYTYENKY